MSVEESDPDRSRLPALALAALGIVYGDIGTSPLYAFRQAMVDLPPDRVSILGTLSMIVWAQGVTSLRGMAAALNTQGKMPRRGGR